MRDEEEPAVFQRKILMPTLADIVEEGIWNKEFNAQWSTGCFQVYVTIKVAGLCETSTISNHLTILRAVETPYPLVNEIKSKPTLIVPNQLFGIYIFLAGGGWWLVCPLNDKYAVKSYPARALRALGLLLADGAPTVGGGKTFWADSRIFLRKQL